MYLLQMLQISTPIWRCDTNTDTGHTHACH